MGRIRGIRAVTSLKTQSQLHAGLIVIGGGAGLRPTAEELIINLAGQVTDNFRIEADPGVGVMASIACQSFADG
jgi:hypothetical protein